jgi:hypothetical protein
MLETRQRKAPPPKRWFCRSLERAAALMAEHNLTMMEVEALGENDRIEDHYYGKQARQIWARSIWGAVIAHLVRMAAWNALPAAR